MLFLIKTSWALLAANLRCMANVAPEILKNMDFKKKKKFTNKQPLHKKLVTSVLSLISQPVRSQCTLSLPSENIRKLKGFLMFSGDRERVHWEQMG